MVRARRIAGAALSAAVAGTLVRPASAAGYDTPILYTARHQAMGGTAIAYVDDPSATFHNPAGLSGVDGLALIGDLSLLLGTVQGSPERNARSIDSKPVLAPFFLVGAGYRAHEWLSVGIGFFPVASGGAEYEYELSGNPFIDSTRVLFLEATPAVSLNVPRDAWLPGELALGLGYRASFISFQREKGLPEDPRILNFDMSGASFTGFRVGAQYHPIDELGFGLVFRNRVEIDAEADELFVFTQTATDASLPFILPAKLGGGVELELELVRLAFDLEWAFQSQNDRVELEGTLGDRRTAVENVFAWQNGVTTRIGAEYRVIRGGLRCPLRVGYVFDSAVTNKEFPTAFGTPPAPTHSVSFGSGIGSGAWQVNGALVHRFGSTTIEPSDLGTGCAFCSYDGDYAIRMTGFYLDASVEIDL